MKQTLLAMTATALLVSASPVAAQTKHLVTGNDFQPFTDESLRAGGLVTEIVRDAYEQAGYQTEVTFTSWKRGARQVETGNATVHFPLVKTDARLKRFHYSDPVFTSDMVPVTRPVDAGAYTSMSDLMNGKTCLPLGWSWGVPKLDNAEDSGDLHVERPDDMGACYRMLDAGRIDYLVLEKPTIPVDAEAFLGDPGKVIAGDFKIGESALHAVFDKDGDKAEIEHFNSALQDLKDSGAYREIVAAHLD